jgi:hypothetical protein
VAWPSPSSSDRTNRPPGRGGYGPGHSPEARQRILDENVLYWYYDGSYVAHRRTPQGVEVLAVGWEEAHKYPEEHPDATLEGVVIGTVSMSRVEIPLGSRRLTTTGDKVLRADVALELRTNQNT